MNRWRNHGMSGSLIICMASLLAGLLHSDELGSEDTLPDHPAPQGFTIELLESLPQLPGDLAPLPEIQPPDYNPGTPAKIRLGRQLFFDKRLSYDRTKSCATCHDPSMGFADGKITSVMPLASNVARNSPSILNSGHFTSQMWDGRAATLEEQGVLPILSQGEMNMPDQQAVAERLNELIEYTPTFKEVFGARPTLNNVAEALAAYERTLVTENSRFDQYLLGNREALTDEEKQGLILFVGKASCNQCHNGPVLSDGLFHNLGLPAVKGDPEDNGRMRVTGDEADRRAFKTPGLRNVEQTAPYMHDGSIGSLEEVIEFYNQGGGPAPDRSELIFPLGLSVIEQAQLVAFLNCLTGEVLEVALLDAEHESANTDSAQSLKDYMQLGIHEEFTFLSYTIWHDQPLTEKKREALRVAAERLVELAEGIPEYREGNRIDHYSAQLAASSRKLAMSASMSPQSEIETGLETVRKSCVDCHAAHDIELFP